MSSLSLYREKNRQANPSRTRYFVVLILISLEERLLEKKWASERESLSSFFILKTFKFTLTSSFNLTLYHPMSFLVQPPCNHHFFIESSHIGFGWFTILISDSEQKFGISNRCLCSVVYTLHKNLQWETEFNSTTNVNAIITTFDLPF